MKYFVVYNDETHLHYLRQLVQSIQQYGPEFKIIVFHKHHMDPSFVKQHESILSLPRGGGYWLWKPYIIHETMKQINDGDTLVYLDSSYYFTESFQSLYDPLQSTDLVVFKNKPNEKSHCMKHLCKMDVVLKYDMYTPLFHENVEEYWAGCIFLKKTERTVGIIQDWLSMCCIPENITDSPSQMPNDSCFWDHRHDQSLLSVVLYQHKILPFSFPRRYLQNCRHPY